MIIQNTVTPISEARAREILTPYLEPLGQAVEAAWGRWLDTSPRNLKALVSRTRANMVYDYICDEIRARFSGLPDVSVQTNRYGMLLLNIKGLILIRFKKVGSDGLGSNIVTSYQTKFNLQIYLPELPDEATRLVVGYRLDKASIKITDIVVACRVGNVIKWVFSLRESVAAAFMPVVLPFPDTAPAISRNKSRVTEKKQRVTGESKKLREQTVEPSKSADEEQRKTSDQ